MNHPVSTQNIWKRIYLIRGRRVMLDRDLATLYGVSTGRLNEQVRRNIRRFPDHFMFQLTTKEMKNWISQSAISNSGIKMSLRKRPLAFSEHGALQAANVLNSERAIEMGIYVIEAFVGLRETLTSHKELARKLKQLELRIESHDQEIRSLFDAIRGLLEPPPKPKPRIGFRPPD